MFLTLIAVTAGGIYRLDYYGSLAAWDWLNSAGHNLLEEDNPLAATPVLEEALTQANKLAEDYSCKQITENQLGMAALSRGDLESAKRYFKSVENAPPKELGAIAPQPADPNRLMLATYEYAVAKDKLGYISLHDKDLDGALGYFRAVISACDWLDKEGIFDTRRFPFSELRISSSLGLEQIYQSQQKWDEAAGMFSELQALDHATLMNSQQRKMYNLLASQMRERMQSGLFASPGAESNVNSEAAASLDEQCDRLLAEVKSTFRTKDNDLSLLDRAMKFAAQAEQSGRRDLADKLLVLISVSSVPLSQNGSKNLINLCNALDRLGRKNEAVEMLHICLKVRRMEDADQISFADLLYESGTRELEMDLNLQAKEHLQAACDIYDKTMSGTGLISEMAILQLARAESRTGDQEKSKKLLARFLAVHKKHDQLRWEAIVSLSEALEREGSYQEALDLVEKEFKEASVTADDRHKVHLAIKASAFASLLKRDDLAEHYARKAQETASSSKDGGFQVKVMSLEATMALGKCYHRAGRLSEAHKVFQNGLETTLALESKGTREEKQALKKLHERLEKWAARSSFEMGKKG